MPQRTHSNFSPLLFFNKFSTVFKNTCNVSTCAIRRNADQILQNYCVCIMLMENIVDCWSD